jgi:hypothetical protein
MESIEKARMKQRMRSKRKWKEVGQACVEFGPNYERKKRSWRQKTQLPFADSEIKRNLNSRDKFGKHKLWQWMRGSRY